MHPGPTVRPTDGAAGRRLLCLVAAIASVAALVSIAIFVYRNLFMNLGRPRSHQLTEASPDKGSEKAMMLKGPLVWEEQLGNLPRPEYKFMPTGLNRPDQHHLAHQAITDALKLRDKGFTFRVIVFAWKRRASLKRLTDSLVKAQYHRFPVHLDIHMDGGAHPRVTEFVDQLEWHHGRIRINRHAERVGLERTIMDSWQPVSDREFAFFFEDDIEVSPRFFEYALVALYKYILPGGKRTSSSMWTDRLVGISLNTPRYDEINMPPRDWVPTMAIGEAESQFLFQLPCSWGALYFPWLWREFLHYYQWRRHHTLEALHNSIPDAATMHWRRSWKKYLIEFMYMRGHFMLYPSLPRQLSFSTHHREPGEHTDAKAEEPLVDDLGTLILDYFTVPLLGEAHDEYFNRIVAEMKPLRELSVVSFHHEKVPSIHSLTQLGLYTVYLMRGANWDHSLYTTNPGCVLDNIAFPVEARMDASKEKYLLYEPQRSLGHQINALRNAVAFAKILNRTLIIPPLVGPNNASITVPIQGLIGVPQDTEMVKTRSLDDFVASHHGWIERIVQFVPWRQRTNEQLSMMRDDLLTQRGVIPAHQVILHSFPTNEADIRGNFSACHDEVLAFRHLFGSFDRFTSDADHSAFSNWVKRTLHFTPPVLNLMEHVAHRLVAKPLACVVYSRGDVARDCGRDVMRLKEPTMEQKLVAFRSCHPSIERTVQYAIEDATTLNISLSALYVMTDIPESVSLNDVPIQTQSLGTMLRKLPVYSQWHIMKELDFADGLSDLPLEIKLGIAELVEARLCEEADFFLGNVYSTISNRTMVGRARGLPSNMLGFKVASPSTPE